MQTWWKALYLLIGGCGYLIQVGDECEPAFWSAWTDVVALTSRENLGSLLYFIPNRGVGPIDDIDSESWRFVDHFEHKLVAEECCVLTDFLRDTFSKDLGQSALPSVELLGSFAEFEYIEGLRQEALLEIFGSSLG